MKLNRFKEKIEHFINTRNDLDLNSEVIFDLIDSNYFLKGYGALVGFDVITSEKILRLTQQKEDETPYGKTIQDILNVFENFSQKDLSEWNVDVGGYLNGGDICSISLELKDETGKGRFLSIAVLTEDLPLPKTNIC